MKKVVAKCAFLVALVMIYTILGFVACTSNKRVREGDSCQVPSCPICPAAEEEKDANGDLRAFWIRNFNSDGSLEDEYIVCSQPMVRNGRLTFKSSGDLISLRRYKLEYHPTYVCKNGYFTE